MTSHSDKSDSFAAETGFRTPRFFMLLALMAISRLGIMVLMPHGLTDDRDAYLALAHQLADGNGYRSSAEAPPTAYRPPLYPAVLALALLIFPERVAVGFVNLICSMLIVAGVWKIACRHWSLGWSTLAALLVIGNPLLLMNATLPMTEVMFSALVLWIICFATKPLATQRDRLRLGVVLGLAALCRPTVWAFVMLYAIMEFLRLLYSSRDQLWPTIIRCGLPVSITFSLVMLPWVIRNYQVFESLIPMTTHGGYTLLLANNSVFYEDVVEQGWRTTWEGESLADWQASLEREMEAANVSGEVERSQWMTRQALNTMRDQPVLFLKSCGTRFLRFWNPAPISTPTRPVSPLLQWMVGLSSILIFLLAGISFCRKPRHSFFLCSAVFIVALTMVHTLYWSNLRMRAPLEAILILLSVSALYSLVTGSSRQCVENNSLS